MYEEKENKLPKRKKEKSATKEKFIQKRKPIHFHVSFKNRFFTNHPILSKLNWRQIGTKLLILFIVIVLIIFTISRINKHQQKQEEILTTNIEKIITVAQTYFEANQKPQNIGDSSSLSLEELKNAQNIEEIKDNNNKYCDYLNSYIILTKTSNEEYRLKVYLKCSNKEKTKEETITCQTGKCIKK